MGCCESLLGGGIPPADPSAYADYLKGLWVETGASKGIDAGVDQGKVEDVIAENGRSKQGDAPREIPFQVVISFPGAEMGFDFKDEDGKNLGSSGFGLALEVRKWLGTPGNGIIPNGLDSEAILLNHFYMDWANLQYVPNTTRVKNFRNRGEDSIASINPNWKFYYVEAQLECNVMIVLCTLGWLESPNCLGEFNDIDEMIKIKPNVDHCEMVFYVLQDEVLKHENWANIKAKADEWGAQVLKYTQSMSEEEKGEVESHLLSLIDNNCILKAHLPKPAVPSSCKMVDWDEETMGMTPNAVQLV